MKHTALIGLFVLAASAQGAFAQTDNLTDQQKLGRQTFAQSCGVCHLPPALGAKTYGPQLNKEAAGGDDEVCVSSSPTVPLGCPPSSIT